MDGIESLKGFCEDWLYRVNIIYFFNTKKHFKWFKKKYLGKKKNTISNKLYPSYVRIAHHHLSSIDADSFPPSMRSIGLDSKTQETQLEENIPFIFMRNDRVRVVDEPQRIETANFQQNKNIYTEESNEDDDHPHNNSEVDEMDSLDVVIEEEKEDQSRLDS